MLAQNNYIKKLNKLISVPIFLNDSSKNILIAEEAILDMLTEIYDEIIDFLDIDLNKWHLFYYDLELSLKVDEAVDILFDWIPERLIFCDSYFSNL